MARGEDVNSPPQNSLPITKIELRAALQALHSILVLARLFAYEKQDHAKIADVLDSAEIMPLLLAGEATHDFRFEDVLQGLAERFPEFTGIWQRYLAEINAGENGQT